MKIKGKKIIDLIEVIVSLSVMIALVGCKYNEDILEEVSDDNFSDITEITIMPCTEYVYDSNTKIVYVICYNTHNHRGGMSPYISAEGTYCKYVDGKIVNVGSNIADTEDVKDKGYDFTGIEEVAETMCEGVTDGKKIN